MGENGWRYLKKMKMDTGVTKDLNKSEEIVLVKIALNPELNGEQLRDKLETSNEAFTDCLDTLINRQYVEMMERDSARVWKVTDLGRLALEKFTQVLKYDLLYAKKRGDVDNEVIQRLNQRKLMFERALRACKGRRAEGDGNGSQ